MLNGKVCLRVPAPQAEALRLIMAATYLPAMSKKLERLGLPAAFMPRSCSTTVFTIHDKRCQPSSRPFNSESALSILPHRRAETLRRGGQRFQCGDAAPLAQT